MTYVVNVQGYKAYPNLFVPREICILDYINDEREFFWSPVSHYNITQPAELYADLRNLIKRFIGRQDFCELHVHDTAQVHRLKQLVSNTMVYTWGQAVIFPNKRCDLHLYEDEILCAYEECKSLKKWMKTNSLENFLHRPDVSFQEDDLGSFQLNCGPPSEHPTCRKCNSLLKSSLYYFCGNCNG
jgi:hypothetical protein